MIAILYPPNQCRVMLIMLVHLPRYQSSPLWIPLPRGTCSRAQRITFVAHVSVDEAAAYPAQRLLRWLELC
jgi:hypothetical protein